jgi:hypothetical protein
MFVLGVSGKFFNSFTPACIKELSHKPWTPSITANGLSCQTKEDAEHKL